jgi:hypothetical protein
MLGSAHVIDSICSSALAEGAIANVPAMETAAVSVTPVIKTRRRVNPFAICSSLRSILSHRLSELYAIIVAYAKEAAVYRLDRNGAEGSMH